MRQLLAVRAAGSIAGAARLLNISQPARSMGVARLEDELGVRLIDRSSSGSVLTPVGEMIAERATRVIEESESLRRDAALVSGGESGFVRLGFAPSLSFGFVQALMVRIAKSHPDLELHVETNERNRLVASLVARELDLVFCVPRDPDGRFVTTEVLRAEHIVVAAPTHPLAAQSQVTISELANHKCAGGFSLRFRSPERPKYYLGLESEFEHLYTSNNTLCLIPLAVAGLTILVAPAFTLAPYIEAGELVRLNVDWTQEAVFAATMVPSSRYSPILNAIVVEAQDVGRSLMREQALRDATSGLTQA